MVEYEQRDKNAALRISVYANLDDHYNPNDLAHLLGYKNLFEMRDNFNSKDISICQALAGPHGQTIYKILQIQKAKE